MELLNAYCRTTLLPHCRTQPYVRIGIAERVLTVESWKPPEKDWRAKTIEKRRRSKKNHSEGRESSGGRGGGSEGERMREREREREREKRRKCLKKHEDDDDNGDDDDDDDDEEEEEEEEEEEGDAELGPLFYRVIPGVGGVWESEHETVNSLNRPTDAAINKPGKPVNKPGNRDRESSSSMSHARVYRDTRAVAFRSRDNDRDGRDTRRMRLYHSEHGERGEEEEEEEAEEEQRRRKSFLPFSGMYKDNSNSDVSSTTRDKNAILDEQKKKQQKKKQKQKQNNEMDSQGNADSGNARDALNPNAYPRHIAPRSLSQSMQPPYQAELTLSEWLTAAPDSADVAGTDSVLTQY